MRSSLSILVLASACSGGPSPEPAASHERVAATADDGRKGAGTAPLEPEAPPPEPAPPVVAGETDGEMPAVAEGETEGSAPARPVEAPPAVEVGQPAAPDATPGAKVEPNLDPEHLQQAREEAMSEREKRAARARAARKAYEN